MKDVPRLEVHQQAGPRELSKLFHTCIGRRTEPIRLPHKLLRCEPIGEQCNAPRDHVKRPDAQGSRVKELALQMLETNETERVAYVSEKN
jgi:hypothetical protein